MDIISVSIYLIYLLSIFFAIFPNFLINQKIFFIFWFIVVISFSYITRQNLEFGFDSDLQGYINIIKNNKVLLCFDITKCSNNFSYLYYSKEFIFWGILELLHFISSNINLTLMAFDIIVSFLIYTSVSQLQLFLNERIEDKNNHNYNYLRFLIIVLFPFLFGMQMILRQYLAMAFGLLAFTYLLNFKRIKGSLFFFFAIFSHNGALILLPLLNFFKNYFFSIIFSFVSIISILYGVSYLSDNRFGINDKEGCHGLGMGLAQNQMEME